MVKLEKRAGCADGRVGHESDEEYKIHCSQSDILEVAQTIPKRRTPKNTRLELEKVNDIFPTRTNLNRNLLTHEENKPYT